MCSQIDGEEHHSYPEKQLLIAALTWQVSHIAQLLWVLPEIFDKTLTQAVYVQRNHGMQEPT